MAHARLVIVAAFVPLFLMVGCASPSSAPLPGPVPVSVPVPAKFVGGYLQSGTSLLPRSLPAGYTLLFSAFALIESNGSVFYEPDQDNDALVADIAARKAAGQPVILSVGGAGGAKSGLTSTSQRKAFLSSIMPVIDKYGFSGIDWDIETDGKVSVDNLAAASRSLVNHYGRAFVITVAPYGSTTATYKQLVRKIKDILTFVGYQFYGTDNIPTPDSVVAEMESWITDCGILPSQFSLGFMPQDGDGRVTSYDTIVSIYHAVRSKYPTVRGVWIWAVNFDQTSGYQFVDTLAPVVQG
jgi:chitinase